MGYNNNQYDDIDYFNNKTKQKNVEKMPKLKEL